MRRSLSVSLAMMAAVIVVGCSTHPQAVPPSTHSIESPTSARASTPTGTVALPATPAFSTAPAASSASAVWSGQRHDHIVLKCEDSAGEGIGDAAGNLQLSSATLTGLRGRNDPQLATDVGLKLPPGANLYFRKTPLYIEAGAGPVTLTLLGQQDEFLSWVPASVWAGGSPPDLQSWATKSVTFQGCAHGGAMYLGGLLAADPTRDLPTHWQPRRAPVNSEDQPGRRHSHLIGSGQPDLARDAYGTP